MVATPAIPAVAVVPQYDRSTLADDPAADASIARYNASGDQVRSLMDLMWKVCVALFVLVLLTWALGLLPGAVKLF
jgi:hypothetical protein